MVLDFTTQGSVSVTQHAFVTDILREVDDITGTADSPAGPILFSVSDAAAALDNATRERYAAALVAAVGAALDAPVARVPVVSGPQGPHAPRGAPAAVRSRPAAVQPTGGHGAPRVADEQVGVRRGRRVVMCCRREACRVGGYRHGRGGNGAAFVADEVLFICSFVQNSRFDNLCQTTRSLWRHFWHDHYGGIFETINMKASLTAS
jgi:hypothetical protein